MQTSEVWELRIVLNMSTEALWSLRFVNYTGLLLNMGPYVSCRGKRQNEVKVK